MMLTGILADGWQAYGARGEKGAGSGEPGETWGCPEWGKCPACQLVKGGNCGSHGTEGRLIITVGNSTY